MLSVLFKRGEGIMNTE